jgi:hypothetical protein
VKKGRNKKKGHNQKVTRRKAVSRAPKRRPARPARSHARPPRKKNGRVTAKQPKANVSRARAASPARSTHTATAPRRRSPLPSPMPVRHVAPPRPVLLTPARSMPPSAREVRKPLAPPSRGPLVVPEFSEAGVLLAITYSIREGRRGEFFDLMRELKPLLGVIGGADCTVYEDRSRPNYFMEVFRFKDEAEFTAFDDKFHKDRRIAAVYALLDDIVEAEKSDFKIFERRL